MTFPVLSANGPSGYNLTRSLRFRQSATAYLNRTPATTTNRRTWTWSAWVKRGLLDLNYHTIYGNGIAVDYIAFANDNSLTVSSFNGTFYVVTTTQVFRDPSAWYHIVVAMDTTQATASNRIKIYVNGVQVTAFSTSTYPSQNYDTGYNTTTAQYLGYNTFNYFDGYLAEVNWVDGQQLTPSSFGSTNSVTGVWQPAKYTGTYGTNGFYLPFTNITSTTTLGYDSSGNGNNWTPNNISLTAGATYDSMTDVPTLTSATAANYCVLNPLNVVSATISGGNLNTSVGASQGYTVGTIGIPTTGKYYFEITSGSTASPGQISIGLQVQASPPISFAVAGSYTLYLGYAGATANLYINNNGTNSSANTVTTASTDVLNLAYDSSTGNLWLGYNNAWKNSSGVTDSSANPATGVNPTLTISAGLSLVPFHHVYSNSGSANFGQRPFTYTPPSGFVALNTYNLPASTVPNGASYMAATLYTGTGSSLTVANTVGSASFQPDWVWIKSRSAATDNKLTDSVRGVTKGLVSNSTAGETTDTQGLTAFGSTGFTVGTNTDYNNLAATYVAWNWKAGGTAVSNTSGSITSSVSANTTSGFSVVGYTGNGTNGATVGHGLGVAPSMVIVKNRNAAGSEWMVYHASLTASNNLSLDLSIGQAAISAFAGGGVSAVSSTTFTATQGSINLNNVNSSGQSHIAYCFAAIKGFSAFGSYTGNGSTDGPFTYTGFRPRYVLVKRIDSAAEWWVEDTSRSTYNESDTTLFPNSSSAEAGSGSGYRIDILSNGFKNRAGGASTNASGGTYIYAAFAENPFQNSLAR